MLRLIGARYTSTMASKPETNFIKKIHRRLSREVYREKMANPYRGGTPDVYYEGPQGVLWVEYKYWQTVKRIFKPKDVVSPLQWLWIQRAHDNNVNIVTIVGYRDGGVIIYPNDDVVLGSQFKNRLQPTADLISWIEVQTLEHTKNTGFGK